MGLDTKTDSLTERQSQCDFDFDLNTLKTKGTIEDGVFRGVRAKVL
jgi:hypothetical protein